MLTKSRIKDFYTDIEIAIQNIQSNPIQKFLMDLQESLNKFFSDSTCKGVIYTDNQDKLFFGAYIMPTIEADDVIKTITTNKKYLIKEYYVELDSKLFSLNYGLTSKEITAIIVHDIGAMVNNSAPSEIVCKNIDQYLADNHESLKLSELIHYKEILSFGFRDAIRKVTCLFETGKYDSTIDTMADFIDWTDYKGSIISGLTKLDRAGQLFFNREVQDKFITLSWVLRVYKDVVGYRISVNKMIERFKELSGSQIEIKEMDNFLRRVNRIDDDMLIESANAKNTEDPLLEEIRLTKYNNKYDHGACFKKFEDDVANAVITHNSIENYNDPDLIPDLLHNVNNTMMMMNDYVVNHINNKKERKQWNKMYKELARRRNQLSNNKFYVPSRRLINIWKNNCGLQ